MLKVYNFAQAMINKYNDNRTPDSLAGAADLKVSKTNILQALGRQTSWGSDCEITLQLLNIYGPSGSKPHPKIVALVQGQVEEGEKEGSGYFLNALRAVDQATKRGDTNIDFDAIVKKKGRTVSGKSNEGEPTS
jgi:hypothetical protein